MNRRSGVSVVADTERGADGSIVASATMGMTSLGTRSCSSISVACTLRSDAKWCCMREWPSACSMASRLMPWWWAMNERTTALVWPRGTRIGV